MFGRKESGYKLGTFLVEKKTSQAPPNFYSKYIR